MNNSLTKEQILAAYNNAPDIVRATFSSEETTQIVVDTAKHYQLHVDQAGALGKNLGYLLLGLLEPNAFIAQLTAAGIPDAQARQITAEVNQKIFVPLREKLKQQSSTPSSSPAPIKTSPPPVKTPPTPPPPPPPPQRQSYFHLENKIAKPHPPVVSQPIYKKEEQYPARSAPPPLLEEEKLLEDHEEPSPVIAPPVKRVPPPQNLPGTMPPKPKAYPSVAVPKITLVPPSAPATRPVPPAAPQQQPPQKQSTPPSPPKAYTVDPYREPIDDGTA